MRYNKISKNENELDINNSNHSRIEKNISDYNQIYKNNSEHIYSDLNRLK